MKSIEQIKKEIIENHSCTNIPYTHKDIIWEWMKQEFKGQSIQIGNLMNSKEFGCCAYVGSKNIEMFLTPEDYNLFLLAV